MKRRILALFLLALLLLTACGKKSATVESKKLADGSYTIDVKLEGGTGRATIQSPAALVVKDGHGQLTVVWSSPYYDYMVVNGARYDFITVEGGSTFTFPVSALDTPMEIKADTTAMSTPHEISYTLTLLGDSIAPVQ